MSLRGGLGVLLLVPPCPGTPSERPGKLRPALHQVAISAHGKTIGRNPSIEEEEQIGDRTTDRHVAGTRRALHLYAVRRERDQPRACSIGTVEAVAFTAVGRKRALVVAARMDHLD